VFHQHWAIFIELIRVPFRHMDLVWGIVPLYFGWMLNELTSSKASFKTATQTGFGFLWAGAHWMYQYFSTRPPGAPKWDVNMLFAVNVLVTVFVLAIGLVALISGLFHRYPKYGSFLGYTRFSNYFMIMIFPMQSNYLTWTWERLVAILIFAVPIWLALQFGFMPLRKK